MNGKHIFPKLIHRINGEWQEGQCRLRWFRRSTTQCPNLKLLKYSENQTKTKTHWNSAYPLLRKSDKRSIHKWKQTKLPSPETHRMLVKSSPKATVKNKVLYGLEKKMGPHQNCYIALAFFKIFFFSYPITLKGKIFRFILSLSSFPILFCFLQFLIFPIPNIFLGNLLCSIFIVRTIPIVFFLLSVRSDPGWSYSNSVIWEWYWLCIFKFRKTIFLSCWRKKSNSEYKWKTIKECKCLRVFIAEERKCQIELYSQKKIVEITEDNSWENFEDLKKKWRENNGILGTSESSWDEDGNEKNGIWENWEKQHESKGYMRWNSPERIRGGYFSYFWAL